MATQLAISRRADGFPLSADHYKKRFAWLLCPEILHPIWPSRWASVRIEWEGRTVFDKFWIFLKLTCAHCDSKYQTTTDDAFKRGGQVLRNLIQTSSGLSILLSMGIITEDHTIQNLKGFKHLVSATLLPWLKLHKLDTDACDTSVSCFKVIRVVPGTYAGTARISSTVSLDSRTRPQTSRQSPSNRKKSSMTW